MRTGGSNKHSPRLRCLLVWAHSLTLILVFAVVQNHYRKHTSTNVTSVRKSRLDFNSTPTRIAPARVAIVKACLGESFKYISEASLNNARNYANYHAYTFLELNESTYPATVFLTPPAWVKIAYLHELLGRRVPYEWLVWFDCDTLVVRQDFPVELALQEMRVSEHHHLVFTEDDPNNREMAPFNSGVFFVRNSGWARKELGHVLRLASKTAIRNHGLWEQEALRVLYIENKFMEQEHFLIAAARWKFNAFDRLNEETNETTVWHRTACRTQPNCDDKFNRKATSIVNSFEYAT